MSTAEINQQEEYPSVEELHDATSSKKEIWYAFFVLLGLTIIEFIVALGIPESMKAAIGGKPVITGIFLFLTVCKAFYIVGYFMHMKHEKLNLVYAILLPLMFVIYFVSLMMFEGADMLSR